MRRPSFMGWSLFGLRPLRPVAQIPRDSLFGTRAVAVGAQYQDEIRLRGQPRFVPKGAAVRSAFGGDDEDIDGYVMVARDDLLRLEVDPEALKGAMISGFMRNGKWCPTDFEVRDVVHTGHLPRCGSILVKLKFRALADLKGTP